MWVLAFYFCNCSDAQQEQQMRSQYERQVTDLRQEVSAAKRLLCRRLVEPTAVSLFHCPLLVLPKLQKLQVALDDAHKLADDRRVELLKLQAGEGSFRLLLLRFYLSPLIAFLTTLQ